jgi:hypothetical protein
MLASIFRLRVSLEYHDVPRPAVQSLQCQHFEEAVVIAVFEASRPAAIVTVCPEVIRQERMGLLPDAVLGLQSSVAAGLGHVAVELPGFVLKECKSAGLVAHEVRQAST